MFCEFCGSGGPSECCVCRSYSLQRPIARPTTLSTASGTVKCDEIARQGQNSVDAKGKPNADILTAG